MRVKLNEVDINLSHMTLVYAKPTGEQVELVNANRYAVFRITIDTQDHMMNHYLSCQLYLILL